MSEHPEHKQSPSAIPDASQRATPDPSATSSVTSSVTSGLDPSAAYEAEQPQVSLPKIPREHVLELRRLVHEMGNALEIVVQTNYLLNMGEADESTKQWLKMMDVGVRQATEVSKEMRQYLMLHTSND